MKLFERRCRLCSVDYEYTVPNMEYYDNKLETMHHIEQVLGMERIVSAERNFWSEQAKMLFLSQDLCPCHAEAASYLVYYDVADRKEMEQAREYILKDLEGAENE